MDIERFKRLSIPKIEAGKMTEVVRDVIKEVRTNKQNVYEKTSEDLLPLTDKIDEEIKEISKLRPTDPVTKRVFDLDAVFDGKELDHLALQYNLAPPSEVFEDVKNRTLDWEEYDQKVTKLFQKIRSQKGNYVKKNRRKLDPEKMLFFDNEIALLKKYGHRIALVPQHLKTLKVGKGIYTQKKEKCL